MCEALTWCCSCRGFSPAVKREESWGQDGWDVECVGFSYFPGGYLIHLKSEHCFKEILSLTRGIHSEGWVRKKICSGSGQCAFVLQFFVPHSRPICF